MYFEILEFWNFWNFNFWNFGILEVFSTILHFHSELSKDWPARLARIELDVSGTRQLTDVSALPHLDECPDLKTVMLNLSSCIALTDIQASSFSADFEAAGQTIFSCTNSEISSSC